MEQIKLKDIINKLKELDEDNCIIGFEVEPDVNCIEDYSGNGWETTKYTYTIIIKGNEIVRRYKNHGGIKEYIKENK